jgi:hypothetical protein
VIFQFSILGFLVSFPNFFKLSPKMFYLGPIYPKNLGHIDTSLNFPVFSHPYLSAPNPGAKNHRKVGVFG